MTGTGPPPDSPIGLQLPSDHRVPVSAPDYHYEDPGSGLPGWGTIVALAAVLRGVAVLVMPVLPEEAYHWLYARHLDIGYYDHPPIIAWMIAAGRAMFGDDALGIRVFPWLCSIGTAAAASWTAKRLCGEAAASWTALLLAVQPATFLASSFAFPDAPMLLFWSLGMAAVVQAFETGRGPWWLAAGAALGAAMISKYTSCFLALSIFLYMLVTPSRRSWLKTPWPYLAVLVAFLVFTPVLVWNIRHDWASLKFQSVGRLEESRSPRVTSALAYLALQAGSVAPLTLPAVVVAVVAGFRSRKASDRLLLFLSLPLLGFFLIVGVSRSTHAFWPLPAWIALTILTGDILARESGRIAAWYRAHWRDLAVVSMVAVGVGVAHSVQPLPGLAPVRSLHGWTAVCSRAVELRSHLDPSSFYLGIGRRYLCPSQMAYHLDQPFNVHAKNLIGEEGLQFTYWGNQEMLRGHDAVIVAEADWSPRLAELLKEHFDRVEESGTPLVIGGSSLYRGVREERYLYYVGHGYRPHGSP